MDTPGSATTSAKTPAQAAAAIPGLSLLRYLGFFFAAVGGVCAVSLASSSEQCAPDRHYLLVISAANICMIVIPRLNDQRRRRDQAKAAGQPLAFWRAICGRAPTSVDPVVSTDPQPRLWEVIRFGPMFLIPIVGLTWPRSFLLLTLNSILFLLASADCLLYLGKWLYARARRRSLAGGIAGATLSILIGGALWCAFVLVILQMEISPNVVRYFPREAPAYSMEAEEEVQFQTSDGLTLSGTFCPGEPGKAAVILFHGVADDRNGMSGFAFQLRLAGYHTLRIDLRAHGKSEGALCTLGAAEAKDAETAIQWLAARDGIDPDAIFLMGASLGGAVALNGARAASPSSAASPSASPSAWPPARIPRGVILLAPLIDVPAMVAYRVRFLGALAEPSARGLLALAWLLSGVDISAHSPSDHYPSEHAPPVILFHGEQDENIPCRLSQEFARRASALTRLIVLPGIDHVGIGTAVSETQFHEIVEFIENPQ